jgi:tetratricopeptide (TPR) repeat protein
MEGTVMKPYQNNSIPLEAQYLYRRGREMLEQRKEDIALVFLKQAVFIAPCFSKAYRELSNCLDWLGRPEEASACRMKASRIDLIHASTGDEGITIGCRDENQPVPGYSLTCLVW